MLFTTSITASTHVYLIIPHKDINNRIPVDNQIYKSFSVFSELEKIFIFYKHY